MNEAYFCPKCGTKIEKGDRFCRECRFDTKILEHSDEAIPEPGETNPSNNLLPVEENDHPTANPVPVKSSNPSANTKIIVIAVLGSALLIGCILFSLLSANNSSNIHSSTSSQSTQSQENALSTPSYSLNEGSYTGEQTVAINKPDGTDVKVYYTIDGTDPTAQSKLYETPIGLSSNTTLKSIAIDNSGTQSAVKTAVYTITTAQTTTTTASSSDAAEKAQFKSNINGTWTRQNSSGVVQYYKFDNDWLVITGEGAPDYIPFYVNVTPGSNGTIGTVLGGKNPISIDCNPLGDDAIYIDGILSTYSQ